MLSCHVMAGAVVAPRLLSLSSAPLNSANFDLKCSLRRVHAPSRTQMRAQVCDNLLTMRPTTAHRLRTAPRASGKHRELGPNGVRMLHLKALQHLYALVQNNKLPKRTEAGEGDDGSVDWERVAGQSRSPKRRVSVAKQTRSPSKCSSLSACRNTMPTRPA